MTYITSDFPQKRNLSTNNERFLGTSYVITTKEAIYLFGEKSARILSIIDHFLKKPDFGIHAHGKKWIFSTFEYLSETLAISLRHTKRLVADLHKKGILRIEKLSTYQSNRTNYYTIDYGRLSTLMGETTSPQKTESTVQTEEKKMALWPCHNGTMSITEYTHIKKLNKSEEEKRVIEKKENYESESESVKPSAQNMQRGHLPKNLAKDMMSVWNDTLLKAKTTLSKDTARFLVAAYIKKFSNNNTLHAWKHYCKTIQSSAYLMGESFQLTLSWALKFSTIDRLMRGELGVKHLESPDEKTPAVHTIQTLDEDPRCREFRHSLLKRYGAGVYVAWIQNLSLFIEDGHIKFNAKNDFHRDMVLQKFKEFWG